MVDQGPYWANSADLPDFVSVFVNPKTVGAHAVSDLYLKNGLTALQIARKVGLSKAEVLRRLHSVGIRRETVKDLAVDRPRPAVRAPFGKRIVAGKVVDCRRELSIARYIVELRGRQGLGWKEVVDRLNRNGHRTRTGLPWKVGTAKMVFDRWNGKV